MEKKEIFTMEVKRSLSGREKFAYGIGAVGKDMVYMLSASYKIGRASCRERV